MGCRPVSYLLRLTVPYDQFRLSLLTCFVFCDCADVTMRLARSMESHGWDVCALHDVLGFGGSGKGTATDWRDAVAKHREVRREQTEPLLIGLYT